MEAKIHPTADVQSSRIGKDTVIWQNTVVLPGASIGGNCNINCFCFVENAVSVGNNVTLKAGVYLWDGIVIEDNVFVGPNVTFTNDSFPRSKQYRERAEQTLVRQGASIGANATILAGIVIGEYAMIGAGSVVTKDVPPHTIWYGNPARQYGYITSEGKKLDQALFDEHGRQYEFREGTLSEKTII